MAVMPSVHLQHKQFCKKKAMQTQAQAMPLGYEPGEAFSFPCLNLSKKTFLPVGKAIHLKNSSCDGFLKNTEVYDLAGPTAPLPLNKLRASKG